MGFREQKGQNPSLSIALNCKEIKAIQLRSDQTYKQSNVENHQKLNDIKRREHSIRRLFHEGSYISRAE
jgi:hypothetical protein